MVAAQHEGNDREFATPRKDAQLQNVLEPDKLHIGFNPQTKGRNNTMIKKGL